MKPRKRPPVHPHDAARAVLGPLDGARIPGGCDCHGAFQTVRPYATGVWVLTVHHDDACPVLHAHMKGAPR